MATRSHFALSPTPGQLALAKALGRGEEHHGDVMTRLDTMRYRSDERDQAERTFVFDQLPLPLMPSAALSHDGCALAHDASGRALIAVRDSDGSAHVFANVCGHRGTRLVNEDGPFSARKLACPYHSWVYNLEGELIGLPRPESFPGLDRDAHHLKAFSCKEAGGILWWSASGTAVPIDDELADDFDALGLGDMQLYKSKVHRVAANWKQVIDAFLESYHVQRLHHASIAGFFADGVVTGDTIGRHQRFAVARDNYREPIDPSDWTAVRGSMTFTYHLFPNAILIVSPDYANLMIAHPGKDVRHCLVEDFMLVPGDQAREAMSEKWEKSWQLLDGVAFGQEDFGAAEKCQAGIDTGERDEAILGTLEVGIANFHAALDALIPDQARS